jgi:hypothetical protein
MAQGKDPVDGRPNGSRTREIAADIDRTRDILDRTVDAIVGKLTPSQLLSEAVGVLRSGSGTILGKVIDTAREHPVPATVVACGVGLLLWERSGSSRSGGYSAGHGFPYETDTRPGAFERVRDKAQDATQGAADALGTVKDTVQEKAHDATEAVRETLHGVKETGDAARQVVREKLHDVRDQAGHLRQAAHQQVKRARIGFWQTMDQQPLVVGGIALALGAAAALLVPTTEKEAELMGEPRERLLERAGEAGRQVLEKGKHVVRAAADVLREEAREEGLSPDQLAEKARRVVRQAEEAALDTAEQERLVPAGATSGSGGGPTSGGSTS